MRQFIALIHKDAQSEFGVSFPDLPGCVTAGATLDDGFSAGAVPHATVMANNKKRTSRFNMTQSSKDKTRPEHQISK